MSGLSGILASSGSRDGGGIFTFVWALTATPFGLALATNFRGFTERHTIMALKGKNRGMSFRSVFILSRITGVVFFILGPIMFTFAIIRLIHGGY